MLTVSLSCRRGKLARKLFKSRMTTGGKRKEHKAVHSSGSTPAPKDQDPEHTEELLDFGDQQEDQAAQEMDDQQQQEPQVDESADPATQPVEGAVGGTTVEEMTKLLQKAQSEVRVAKAEIKHLQSKTTLLEEKLNGRELDLKHLQQEHQTLQESHKQLQSQHKDTRAAQVQAVRQVAELQEENKQLKAAPSAPVLLSQEQLDSYLKLGRELQQLEPQIRMLGGERGQHSLLQVMVEGGLFLQRSEGRASGHPADRRRGQQQQRPQWQQREPQRRRSRSRERYEKEHSRPDKRR